MTLDLLFDHFDQLITRPEDIPRLNQAILQLAVQGKLLPQDPADEPASELLKRIRAEKDRLLLTGQLRRDTPLPPLGKDEIPFDLPLGWVWVRLGNIAVKLGAGSTPKGGKQVYQSYGIKFIRSQNVWDDGLWLENVAFISDEINENMSGSIVQPKDVLLNITGASIGRSAVVPDDFDIGNVNQHVSIIRLTDLELRHFVHLWLISPYVQNLIMDVQVGISREGLSMGRLANFPILLPPLAEQKRIVAKVECLLKLCDELKAGLVAGEAARARLLESLLYGAVNGVSVS
jgi:type I restriction enzyme S subunit